MKDMQELIKRYMDNTKLMKAGGYSASDYGFTKATIENELLEWILED